MEHHARTGTKATPAGPKPVERGVTARQLVQRCNRILAQQMDDQLTPAAAGVTQSRIPRGHLHAPTIKQTKAKSRARTDLGEFYMEEAGRPARTHLDLEDFARQLDAIKAWEYVIGGAGRGPSVRR
jgi:1,6-anhydro-N-acetylmuramate kinase